MPVCGFSCPAYAGQGPGKDDDRDVEWQVPGRNGPEHAAWVRATAALLHIVTIADGSRGPGPEDPHEGLHLVPGVAGQHHDDEVPPFRI